MSEEANNEINRLPITLPTDGHEDSSDDDMSEEANNETNRLPIRLARYSADSSSDDGEEPSTTEIAVEFDTNIPTTHKYLGKLDNVSGYTLYEAGEILTLLAIHTNTLVFPGFTLPLVMTNKIEQTIMENYMNNNIFALICTDEQGSRLFKYGVTMEVFETYTKQGTLYLKAKGRQRCKILLAKDVRHLGGRLQQITVKILAEPQVGSPIQNTQLLTLKLRRKCSSEDYENLMAGYKHRRFHLAQYANATWVYDRNEVCFYVKMISKYLERFYIKENIPSDPLVLSYWLIQNFQLAHEERLNLMKLDSAFERLRLELKYLAMERLICCGTCKIEIANQKDVFAMSKDGVQSNYCNPGGYVYETVTVSEAQNFYLIGMPSSEFSWFPGYFWTTMQCKVCRCHIGWKFHSKHLQPHMFYGLAKSGLDIKIVQNR